MFRLPNITATLVFAAVLAGVFWPQAENALALATRNNQPAELNSLHRDHQPQQDKPTHFAPTAVTTATAPTHAPQTDITASLPIVFDDEIAQPQRPGDQTPHQTPRPQAHSTNTIKPATTQHPTTEVTTGTTQCPTPSAYVVIKVGDTVWSIAQRHCKTVQYLQQRNRLANAHCIRAGEILWLN